MSSRAIAPVVGADQKTVSNDLRSREEVSSPATGPRTKTGLDGITALLAWAARLGKVAIMHLHIRLRAYVGGTLAD